MPYQIKTIFLGKKPLKIKYVVEHFFEENKLLDNDSEWLTVLSKTRTYGCDLSKRYKNSKICNSKLSKFMCKKMFSNNVQSKNFRLSIPISLSVNLNNRIHTNFVDTKLILSIIPIVHLTFMRILLPGYYVIIQ